jgi:nitrogen fixation protein FixH
MTTMRQRFTGRHMTAILVGFFAVVVMVNFMMAHFASSTFGGVVVENSYVASQDFNRWLDEAAAEKALGWQVSVTRQADARVRVQMAGVSAEDVTLAGIARHPLGRMPEQTLSFAPGTDGSFVSTVALPEGRWRLRLTASARGKARRSEVEVP